MRRPGGICSSDHANQTYIRLQLSFRVGAILGSCALAAVLSVAAQPATAAGPLRLTAVGQFRQPVHVTGSEREPRAFYVLERGGRVWRVGRDGGRRLVLDARPFVRLREPRNQLRDQG